MKKFTTLLTMVALSVGCLQAQQWSDVGNQGFTPSPFGVVENQPDMIVIGTTPYMAYVTTSNQIVVMRYTAGTWTALPTVATSGQTPDLAVDNSGTLYIVYQSSGAANVKKFDGTNWVFVGSASFNNVLGITGALMPRIAIDPFTNAPFVIFVDATNNVNAAKFNGTAWVIVGQQDFLSGTFPRLAITTLGIPFVVVRSNTGFISVSKFDGTNWVAVGPAGFTTLSGFYSDIALDGAGVPYVLSTAFAVPAKSTVFKFNGTAWVVVGAQSFTSSDVRYAQLKFSNAGVLHIVYTNGSNSSRANVMKFDGTNWVDVGTPNFSSALAQTPSLSFDTSNVPYVGYGDASFSNSGTVMKLCTSSTATILSAPPVTVCNAGTATLSATANTASLRWYNSVGLQLATGTSYTTPSLSATTTYAVAAYDANGCSSSRTNVVVTVSATPTVVSSNGGGVCVGNAAGISATVSVGTVSWYSVPTGGVPLATNVLSGSTFTTPIINTATTFYAEAVNNGCVSAARTAVTPVLFQRPANPVAVGGSRCGPGTVSISVTSEPGTVQWFTASVGGTLLQASGNTFITPSISTSTTYYADVTVGGCVSTGRTPVLAQIKLIPTITSSTPANRCGDGSVTLSVTTSGDASAQWFTSPTGGTAISTAKTFATPSLMTTTTYYAEAIEDGCPSTTRTAVVATIKPIPTISSANVSRCDAGTVTFEASSNGTISWFAAATGGSALGTGPNFTTPSISVTTPYFIEAILNGCTTPSRTSISAIVNATPPQPSITQINSNIEAPILTSNASSGNQWFKNDVMLPGETGTSHTISNAGVYKVQVSLNGCTSPFSQNVTYVVTGTEDLSSITRLYPNPVADVLVIDLAGFNKGEIVTISVVDFLGRYVKQEQGKGGDELYMDVNPFSPGQYHLVLTQGKTRVTKSFIRKF